MQILNRLRQRPTSSDSGGDFTLIVGLGNPGREYAGNRHNVGFQIADRVVAAQQLSFSKVQHQAMIALGRLRDHRVVIAKPQTYMNDSGRAVSALLPHPQGPNRVTATRPRSAAPRLMRPRRRRRTEPLPSRSARRWLWSC